MSTSDVMNNAQRPLAEHAFDLKRQYKETFGLTKPQFMRLYDAGEVQLSSVLENLLVAARNQHGLKTERASAQGYDFVKIRNRKKIPLGDMKTCTLLKYRNRYRYCVRNVHGKQGTIYAVGYNIVTQEFNYFAIPPTVEKPRSMIVVSCNRQGKVTGRYGQYECASFEAMIKQG